MRWVVAVFTLTVVAGCSHDRFAPMGDEAAAFGSTPALSTVQAFAVGTWRSISDPTVKSKSDWMHGFSDSKVYSLLTLTADGRATLEKPGLSSCIGHGSWTVAGDQIALSFTDVDGLSFGEVQAQWDKRLEFQRSLGRFQGPDDGIEGARHDVASDCNPMPNLAVAADGRHLEYVGERNASHEAHFGRLIWARVR